MISQDKIILGIDPGTKILGFGVIAVKGKQLNIIDFGIINLKNEVSHFLVLQRILLEVSKLIRKYKPDIMAIEAPFYGKNPQVMLKLGRAQGAAIASALLKDIPIFEYAPRSVKLAITGRGSASKEQVSLMVQRILNFKCEVKYLDATDALAIALCHYYTENSISSVAASEDFRIKLSSSKSSLSKKNSASSMRVGKSSLSNLKSNSQGGDWKRFIKDHPEREIKKSSK